MEKIPVIAVVGPTASGKTALAVDIAKRYGGEVVSADSMQIYKDADIATAKPTAEEMCGVPHHLIGFLPLSEQFSVADYKRLAGECIKDIHSRGKLPVLAGGTGLYIDSLLDNIEFTEIPTDQRLRSKLQEQFKELGGEEMLKRLSQIDPEAAKGLHEKDEKRIIRAFELYTLTGETKTEQVKKSRLNESPYNTLYIGLTAQDRGYLYDRINRRVDVMLEKGLLEEAKEFFASDCGSTAKQAIGYKELLPYLKGEESLEYCIDRLKAETRHYAKRQLTWFNKNKRINWLMIDTYGSYSELLDAAFTLTDKFYKEVQNEKAE